MPKKSTKTPVAPGTRPKLKGNERNYADWLHTPEGQEFERKAHLKARERPTLVVDVPITPTEAVQLHKQTGANLVLKQGSTMTPNEPGVIEGLLARAAAKATQAISLRIPVEDLEAAKRLAAETGIGYQVILKDLIHEGLKRAY